MDRSTKLIALSIALLLLIGCAERTAPGSSTAGGGADSSTAVPEPGSTADGDNTVFEVFEITKDAGYLAELTAMYTAPLRPFEWQSWASAGEVPAGTLVNFCAYNNLLGLTPGEANNAAQEDVEDAVMLYFDVTPAHLRTAAQHEADGTYLLPATVATAHNLSVLDAEQDADLLILTVGLFADGDAPDRPRALATLTVRQAGMGDYKYISFIIK